MGKEFLLAMGDRNVNPTDTDELLKSKISQRKRKEIERQEEMDEATHEAKLAEAKKKTKSADAAVEKAADPNQEAQGLKFVGTINYPEMLQNQIKDRDKLREQAEEAASSEHQVSNDLREKLHASEMLVLKTGFDSQMQVLTKLIESNTTSKGKFTEELEAARTIATEMGYSQPGATGGTDMATQIAMKKLDFELQDRKFEQDIRLRELDDARAARREEAADRKAAAQTDAADRAKSRAFWDNLPNVVGGALAEGYMKKERAGGVAAEPAQRGGETQEGLELPFGESAQGPCSNCGETVAISPATKMAECAKCGAKYPIRRVKAKTPAGPPSEVEEDEE